MSVSKSNGWTAAAISTEVSKKVQAAVDETRHVERERQTTERRKMIEELYNEAERLFDLHIRVSNAIINRIERVGVREPAFSMWTSRLWERFHCINMLRLRSAIHRRWLA